MRICGNGQYSLESNRKETVRATLKDIYEASEEARHWIRIKRNYESWLEISERMRSNRQAVNQANQICKASYQRVGGDLSDEQ